jgi:hypothetical protein
MSLQKVHACPFVIICKLMWHLPLTNSVIFEVRVDDGTCSLVADVELTGCVSEINHPLQPEH